MNKYAGIIVEMTFTGIFLFWLITDATGFTNVLNAISKGVVGGVQTIWGVSGPPNSGR